MKITNVKMIEESDWSNFVSETYKRPYRFQQQDGCQQRGIHRITVPEDGLYDEEMNDSVPEVINGDEMGVKFEVWLARDPETALDPSDEELKDCPYYFGELRDKKDWKESKNHISLFWERNFYPDINMVANDLHKKGLLPAGKYIINIDW